MFGILSTTCDIVYIGGKLYMKVFCCGCEKVRQSDGTWKTETIDKKRDSSTFCPECQRINEQAMLSYQKEKKLWDISKITHRTGRLK
jgi:hypothetical protein